MAKRGNKGGVVLALAAKEITLDLIAEAVDGSEWRNQCLLGFKDRSDERAAPATPSWKSERDHIHRCLKDISWRRSAPSSRRARRRWPALADALPEKKAKPRVKKAAKPGAKPAAKKVGRPALEEGPRQEGLRPVQRAPLPARKAPWRSPASLTPQQAAPCTRRSAGQAASAWPGTARTPASW
jgi:hypothetical protein